MFCSPCNYYFCFLLIDKPDGITQQVTPGARVGANELIRKIDEKICTLNDDYAVERTSALKEVFIEVLPEEKFLQFMAQKGKLGSQHKFPRVLKGKMLDDWNKFLSNGTL